MTRSRTSSGPWDYLLGGAGVGLGAGVLASMGYGPAAYVAGLVAGVALLIGSIAQGIRVGAKAHRRDEQVTERQQSARHTLLQPGRQ